MLSPQASELHSLIQTQTAENAWNSARLILENGNGRHFVFVELEQCFSLWGLKLYFKPEE